MKKRMAVLGLTMVLALTACGGDGDDTDDTTAETTATTAAN
jgi:protein involved in sex pheromone biosynthesis